MRGSSVYSNLSKLSVSQIGALATVCRSATRSSQEMHLLLYLTLDYFCCSVLHMMGGACCAPLERHHAGSPAPLPCGDPDPRQWPSLITPITVLQCIYIDMAETTLHLEASVVPESHLFHRATWIRTESGLRVMEMPQGGRGLAVLPGAGNLSNFETGSYHNQLVRQCDTVGRCLCCTWTSSQKGSASRLRWLPRVRAALSVRRGQLAISLTVRLLPA